MIVPICVSVALASQCPHPNLPDEKALTAIAQHTLAYLKAYTDTPIKSAYELGVAYVDSHESQQLNRTYRHKDKPTNVLSFASEMPDMMADKLTMYPLGDLVICTPVVAQEAITQQKTIGNHLTHLIVHGILHLLGYDHDNGDEEAAIMENLEIQILSSLGIGNPYQDPDPNERLS